MKYLYLLFVLSLVSCSNFAPIYGEDKEFETFLSAIEIEEVETLENTELNHHLTKLFGASHDTKYTLKIELSDIITPLIITGQANVVKQNVTQLCYYILIDKSSGLVLLEGQIRLVGSYSSMSEPYASYTHEKYTKKSIAQTVAEELRMRLMMYFSKDHNKKE